jgi:hypothetical protein
VTPGHLRFLRAQKELATVRSSISRAATEERKAREHFEQTLLELGPIHPLANEARRLWRTARDARHRAEVEVEAATYALDDAATEWEREAASAWAGSAA